MKKIDIDIRTISPMFSGRGDNLFSLTPQSVRGVLRFWFRAVLPRVVNIVDNKGNPKNKGEDCEWNYKLLKDIESYIFGSTEMKSPFDVIVKNATVNKKSRVKGKKYEFYGLENKEYILPKSKFKIQFIIKKPISNLDIFLLELIKLVSDFGGFGARTKKGYGAFTIEKATINNNLYRFNSEFDLKIIDEKMKLLLDDKIFNDLKFDIIKKNNIDVFISEYPTLIEGSYIVYEGKKSFNNWNELSDFLYSQPFLGKIKKEKNKKKGNNKNIGINSGNPMLTELFKNNLVDLDDINSLANEDEETNSKGVYRLVKSSLRGTDFKKAISNFKYLNNDLKIKYSKYESPKFLDSIFGLPINFFIKKKSKPYFFKYNENFGLKSTEDRKSSQVIIKPYENQNKIYYKVIIMRSNINNCNNSQEVNLNFDGYKQNIKIKKSEYYKEIEKIMTENDLIKEGGK